MNYKNIYDSLISKAKNRNLNGYKERHHIIVKKSESLKSNKKENNIENTTSYIVSWVGGGSQKLQNIRNLAPIL